MKRFCSILLVGMLSAQPLWALSVSATYTGLVSEGFDLNGEFGLGAGANLSGRSAILVFSYDTAIGNRYTGPDSDGIRSGSFVGTPPAILSYGITINGVTLSGAPTQRATLFVGENGPVAEVQHWAQDRVSTSLAYHTNYAIGGGTAPLGAFPNSLDVAFASAINAVEWTGFGFTDYNFVTSQFERDTWGLLNLSTVRIDGPDPSPVPLPAALPLLAMAIGLTSLVRRRRGN